MLMWLLQKNTPKRLPTWVGGIESSPYTTKQEEVEILDAITPQPYFLASVKFNQVFRVPFLVGFKFIDLGVDGQDNSRTRNVTTDLNSCFFISTNQKTSQQVLVDFYFTDLNFYTDLSWVNDYSDAKIFVDSNPTAFRVEDFKGLVVTTNTLIKVRLEFDVFQPFLGFSPSVIQKRILKFPDKFITTITASYGGKTYRTDRLLGFGNYSFFNLDGDSYLCR